MIHLYHIIKESKQFELESPVSRKYKKRELHLELIVNQFIAPTMVI